MAIHSSHDFYSFMKNDLWIYEERYRYIATDVVQPVPTDRRFHDLVEAMIRKKKTRDHPGETLDERMLGRINCSILFIF